MSYLNIQLYPINGVNRMNLVKKIIIALSVMVGSPAAAGMISLDSMLNGAHDEVAVRKALLEAVVQYGKVVLYFGADWCKYCKSTKAAILELLSQFPDVMFIISDITKYPFLKN